MAAIFPDNILKCIFLDRIVWISIIISLKFFHEVPIDNKPTLVQIMTRRNSASMISGNGLSPLPHLHCRDQYCWIFNFTQSNKIRWNFINKSNIYTPRKRISKGKLRNVDLFFFFNLDHFVSASMCKPLTCRDPTIPFQHGCLCPGSLHCLDIIPCVNVLRTEQVLV